MPDCNLTLVGEGDLEKEIKFCAREYANISFKGYIKGFIPLMPIYAENSFFILNSKRSETWEEFFGITLIESMACGLVPLSTDHTGPLEIISANHEGLICQEDQIRELICVAKNMSEINYQKMKNCAIERSKYFIHSNISEKWKACIELKKNHHFN